jgi:uncharacterized protein YjbI with pentapeptide repeats
MTDTHQYPPIEIKHRWTNDVLFSSAKAKSLRDAVIEAVASGANLSYANLNGANLSDSNLIRADLYGADLYGANLYGANLISADLNGADLNGADLNGADLNGSKIVSVAQISFTGHGQCGRTLIAIQTETAIYICCGCFAGSPDELRAWIIGDEKRLAKTRTLALDTALILLAAKNDEVGE